MHTILIGNSFPLMLIRREVRIVPVHVLTLQQRLHEASQVRSYWGHASSVRAASDLVGCDLTPHTLRPVIELTSDGRPSFQGEEFQECWVLSAEFRSGVRPAIGTDLAPTDIIAWRALHLRWP